MQFAFRTLRKHLGQKSVLLQNMFLPTETIQQVKEKWNRLAQESPTKLILTKKNLQGEALKKSGLIHLREQILDDAFLMEHLGEPGTKTVLEIGCGIGRTTQFMGRYFKKVYGTDISEEMIGYAKEHVEDKNISFIATDGLSQPFEEESVDLIFSFETLSHIPSLKIMKKTFHEIARVLKRGGIAKIHLRGVPITKKTWSYGIHIDTGQIKSLIGDLPLALLKSKGDGQRDFWVWLRKM